MTNIETIREAFPKFQLEEAIALGIQQTTGAIADLVGHIHQLSGVEVERITSGWIIKSDTAVRTKYFFINTTANKITIDTLWHDGSADIETASKPLTATNLLRLFSNVENIHN